LRKRRELDPMARGGNVQTRSGTYTSTGRHGMPIKNKKPEPDRLGRCQSKKIRGSSSEAKKEA
jgi:hypothetical protein